MGKQHARTDGNVSRQTEILKKNQKSLTVTEMKNAFDGLTVRLNATEARTSELEDRSIKLSKTEKQRE